MAARGFVISVRCRKVPAGLAKVPTWILPSPRRSSGHVPPRAFSAIRARRSASQQRITWARIRSSRRCQAGPGGDDAAQLGALANAELVRVPDHFFELGDHPCPDGGVALGGLGVEADDEPLVLGDPHLLDLEVPIRP